MDDEILEEENFFSDDGFTEESSVTYNEQGSPVEEQGVIPVIEEDLDAPFSLTGEEIPLEKGEEDEEIEFKGEWVKPDPHAFVKAVGVAASFPSGMVVYLSILRDGNDAVRFIAHNKDVFYSTRIAASFSSDKVLPKELFLSLSQIKVLVSSFPRFGVEFRENKAFYRTMYSCVSLETFNFVRPLMIAPEELKYKPFLTDKKLLFLIKAMLSAHKDIAVTASKVLVSEETIKGFFNVYSFSLKTPYSFKTPFYLRKSDLAVLVAMADNTLSYCIEGDRVLFHSDSGYFNMPLMSGNVRVGIQDVSLVSGEKQSEVSLNITGVKKALMVLSYMKRHYLVFEQHNNRPCIVTDDGSNFQVGVGEFKNRLIVPTELYRSLVSLISAVHPGFAMAVYSTGISMATELLAGFSLDVHMALMSSEVLKRNQKIAENIVVQNSRINELQAQGKFIPNREVKGSVKETVLEGL